MQVNTTALQDFILADKNPRTHNSVDGVRLHVPEHQARLLPNHTVKIPGMKDEYIIGLDVFHQLHCLNLFRKLIYPERYDIVTVFANGTRNEETTLHLGRWIL